MKNAYAPESLPVLAARLIAWRASPHERRTVTMARMDWADVEGQTRKARILIWSGLTGALVAAVVIAAAWQMQHKGWRGIRLLLTASIVLAAAGQILTGVALEIGARRKGRRLRAEEAAGSDR
jgi:hypothetical protein